MLGATAVVAAGLGLAAMVFALADRYVWKPLPYADPDRLVSIEFGLAVDPGAWVHATQADVPSLASWQAKTDIFEGLAAFEDRGWLRVQLAGRIVPLQSVAATGNLLEVLGLARQEDAADPSDAWVSSRAATTMSGGELQPGRTVPVVPDGVLRVRRLLPGSFLLPEADRTLAVDALVIRQSRSVLTRTNGANLLPHIVARTRPGVTAPVIQAALSATMPAGPRISVVPLSVAMTGRLRGLANGALAASGLIVFVCWINVFGLALTRGLYRQSEFATRTALGAMTRHLATLLAIEGLQVAVVGSAIAVAVARFALAAVLLVLPPQFATLGVPALTSRGLIAVVTAGAVAGLAWFLASTLAWRLGVRRSSRHIAGADGRALRTLRFVLVAGELAVATVLIAGAALLGRSYLNLAAVDVGMDERTGTVTVAHDSNMSPSRRSEVIDDILAALRRAPGVTAAGAASGGLLDGRNKLGMARVGGPPILVSEWNHVAGDYLTVMGLRFVAGSPPRSDQRAAAVMNEQLAQQSLPGRAPVGQTLLDHDGNAFSVVGVVQDARSKGLSLRPASAVYVVDGDWGRAGQGWTMTYVVRTSDGLQLPPTTSERIVRHFDPMAVTLDAGTIGERLGRSVRDRTFATSVVGLFALASILVTALGLAVVVAYTVVKRTREIAVRLALGATGPRVTRLIAGDASAAATCGVTVGLVAASWVSRGLTSLVYGIEPTDLATLLIAATGLLAVALGAAILPARRAARISPAVALRDE
jgi:predicted permease